MQELDQIIGKRFFTQQPAVSQILQIEKEILPVSNPLFQPFMKVILQIFFLQKYLYLFLFVVINTSSNIHM